MVEQPLPAEKDYELIGIERLLPVCADESCHDRKSLEFCKNQSMKGAILQSVELLKEGKFEEIQKTIEDSLKISTEQDMGHDYFDSFKSRQQVHARTCIPTGFPLLDANEVLDGGLAHVVHFELNANKSVRNQCKSLYYRSKSFKIGEMRCTIVLF